MMDIRDEILKNSGIISEESPVEKVLHDEDTKQIFAEVDDIVSKHKKVIEALAK